MQRSFGAKTAWTQPYRPHLRQVWSELRRSELARPRFYIFTLSVGIVIAAAMGALAAAWMPGSSIPWVRMALVPPGFLVVMCLMIGGSMLLPSAVVLTDAWAQRSLGGGARRIPARSIRAAEIVRLQDEPAALVIRFTEPQGREDAWRLFIAPGVDLANVEGHLREWDRVFHDRAE